MIKHETIAVKQKQNKWRIRNEEKVISLFLGAALIAASFTGCGSSQEAAVQQNDVAKGSGGESEYGEFITVDVFDSMANYQEFSPDGLQRL